MLDIWKEPQAHHNGPRKLPRDEGEAPDDYVPIMMWAENPPPAWLVEVRRRQYEQCLRFFPKKGDSPGEKPLVGRDRTENLYYQSLDTPFPLPVPPWLRGKDDVEELEEAERPVVLPSVKAANDLAAFKAGIPKR